MLCLSVEIQVGQYKYKLNAQFLRLIGLHSDVNDAHRAGANRLQNKTKSLSSSVSSGGREPPSKVRKNNAVLKRAMTARHGEWARRDWGARSKSQWHASTIDDTAQCSKDE